MRIAIHTGRALTGDIGSPMRREFTVLGDAVKRLVRARGEITLTVGADRYLEVARTLRDEPALRFEQLIDLTGVDYSSWGDGAWTGLRFAAVCHLTSVSKNWRLRLRVFATDDGSPVLPPVVVMCYSS